MKLYRRYLVLNKCHFQCVACCGCLVLIAILQAWPNDIAPPTRLECYCIFTAGRWSEASFFCDSWATNTFIRLQQWNCYLKITGWRKNLSSHQRSFQLNSTLCMECELFDKTSGVFPPSFSRPKFAFRSSVTDTWEGLAHTITLSVIPQLCLLRTVKNIYGTCTETNLFF